MKLNEHIEKFTTIVIDPQKLEEIGKEGIDQLMTFLECENSRMINDMQDGIPANLKISNVIYRRRRRSPE